MLVSALLLWGCGGQSTLHGTGLHAGGDDAGDAGTADVATTDSDAGGNGGPSCPAPAPDKPADPVAAIDLAFLNQAADGHLEVIPADSLDSSTCQDQQPGGSSSAAVGAATLARDGEIIEDFGAASTSSTYYVLVSYDDPGCDLQCGKATMALDVPSSDAWNETDKLTDVVIPANIPCGDDQTHYLGVAVHLNVAYPGMYTLAMQLQDSTQLPILNSHVPFCLGAP